MSNLLASEVSPYLQQHAGNPVHWRPWGQEAFLAAEQENKPIFLSVGYSTCHWCHVMAHESFEDMEVAELLNSHFVSIKVDREERPDVDTVYMQVCQAMTGSGGWPLSVFLTPDQKPFFAGTYFPKETAYGQAGFVDILKTVAKKWKEDPEALRRNGLQVAKAFSEVSGPAPGKMTRKVLQETKGSLRRAFDSSYGGFGHAPKFPSPHILLFLMRYAVLEQDTEAMQMVEKTLTQMYKGGIWDHLGGGFSRYATEERWLIPHFEKMLYDNALLTMAYTEAYQITGKTLYAKVATSTLEYVLREMTHPEGGFFSAQDADSQGEEGAYYTWTPQEIIRVLGEAEGQRFNRLYGVTQEGVLEGKSILNRLTPSQEEEEHLSDGRKKLYDYRRASRSLLTDDKVLTGWNGLMIAAFAKAAHALKRPDFLTAALRADVFVQKYLTDPEGGLHVHTRADRAVGKGTLDDYAFLAWAKLCLYEATFDYTHIRRAEALCRLMVRKFYDEKLGDFFLSEPEAGLIFRPKEIYDGAAPSGSSVAAYVLFRLSHILEEDAWAEYATQMVERIAGAAASQPSGYCFGQIAGFNRCYLPSEIICVAQSSQDIMAFAETVGRKFVPHGVVMAKCTQDMPEDTPRALRTYDCKGYPAAYYLCQNGACQSPVHDLNALAAALDTGKYI